MCTLTTLDGSPSTKLDIAAMLDINLKWMKSIFHSLQIFQVTLKSFSPALLMFDVAGGRVRGFLVDTKWVDTKNVPVALYLRS